MKVTKRSEHWEMVAVEFKDAIADQKEAILENGWSAFDEGWLSVFEDGFEIAQSNYADGLPFLVTFKTANRFLIDTLEKMIASEKARYNDYVSQKDNGVTLDQDIVDFGEGRIEGITEWRNMLVHKGSRMMAYRF